MEPKKKTIVLIQDISGAKELNNEQPTNDVNQRSKMSLKSDRKLRKKCVPTGKNYILV